MNAGGPAGADPIGAAAEEAARLVDALGQWLAARSARTGGPVEAGGLNAHLATGSAECRICPLCQLISLARNSSPELSRHLDEAMESLLALARVALDGFERQRAGNRPSTEFETITIS